MKRINSKEIYKIKRKKLKLFVFIKVNVGDE